MQTIDMKQLANALKQHGLSVTHPRKEVFAILLQAVAPMTIQELILVSESMHQVTVYRTLNVLMRIGVVKQVPIGFKNRYEVSDVFKPHHHHVTCEMCGISISIHDEVIEKRMQKITTQTGMQPTKHHFEAYGICNNCNK